MANQQLPNDVVRTIPIMGKDAAGDTVPLPAGVTPTIKSSDPGINAVINGSSYTLNATVPLVSNVSIELDDGSLTPEVTVWDVVADVAPTSVLSNFAAATDAPQPVPTAAAPAPAAPAPAAPAPAAPDPNAGAAPAAPAPTP